MKNSCYFKILHFINRNKKDVQYLFLQNNRHKTEAIVEDKSVRIEKKGASVQGHLYYPETFCLNCNHLCPAKACSVSQIDQSKFDSLFLSYVYSKMEMIHIARNEAYGRKK